jgi:hypothetical protein
MNAQAMTHHDLEAKIAQRSWEDAGFRNELIADPAGALVNFFRFRPTGCPGLSSTRKGGLSDADLERVAGGFGTPATTAVSTAVVVTDFALGLGVPALVTISVGAMATAESGW